MATQNFRVKNGLEVGSNIVLNGATGIISATSVTVGGQPVGSGVTVDTRTNSLVVSGVSTLGTLSVSASTITPATTLNVTGNLFVSDNFTVNAGVPGIGIVIQGSDYGGEATGFYKARVDDVSYGTRSKAMQIGRFQDLGSYILYNNGDIETIGRVSSNQLNISGISTFTNVRVTGIVTASSISISDSGSINGSLLIDNISNSYTELIWKRSDTGANGPSIYGIFGILFIDTPGANGRLSLGGPSATGANSFYDGGNVILNHGAQGTTLLSNGLGVIGLTTTTTLNVTGVSTFAGITTVTGQTLFTKQLSVSGVSTFLGAIQSPGDLTLQTSRLIVNNADNSEVMMIANQNGSIDLYYNNVKKLETTNTGVTVTGSVSATSFIGDGSGLTGVTATGSGIEVRDSGSVVGTAATIDFGDNLTLSAVSAGVVTVTASGGGGIAGIDTTGTSVFNQLNVSGVSTFAGITTVTGQTLFAKQLNVSGISTFGGALVSQVQNYFSIMSNAGFTADGPEGRYLALAYQTNPNYILNNVGIGTTTSLHSPSKLTVKGNTSLETLNVSGISTFSGTINAGTGGILFDTNSYTGSDEPIKLWVGNSGGSRYFTLTRSNSGQVIFNNAYPTTGHNDHRAPTHSFTQTNGSDYYALFYNGSVKLYHPASASGILDQKLETIGAGVTVTGTTFTNQLNVSGVSTFAGITTVTGPTLFAKQLNTSGIATINLLSSGLSSGLEFINPGGFGKFRLGADGGDSVGRLSWYNSSGQQMAAINGSVLDGALDIYNYTTGSQNITISAGNAVVLQHGGANTKLNTTSSGVTITGNLLVGTGVTIYGNSGIVSATTFYGNVVGNITGSITDATNLTGGTANAASLNVSGIVTISAGRIQANAASNLRFGNIAAGAGSVRNIAIGDQVLVSLSGGSGRNIGIGELSYYDTTTGQYNVGLGIQAGQKITTGSYNVILGAYDGNSGNLDIRTSSNNIVIADGQGNIRQYINSSGNVGIKTTVITEALTVAGVVSATSYSGSGIGLTGIPAGQLTGALPVLDGSNLFGVTATGSGIQVRDDGSVVGTAATVDFGTNLSVSFASGTATVSGASSVSAATTAYGLAGTPNVTLGRVLAGVSTFNTGYLDVYDTTGTNLNAAFVRTGGTGLFGFNNTDTVVQHGSLTGDLQVLSETAIKLKSAGYVGGVETYAEFVKNSGVSLYYDNTKKFETTGYGISVYGGVNAPTGVITASSFTGSGSGLTNIPAGQLTGTLPAIDGSALLNVTAAGTGVAVRDDNSPVGSATTINFGTGLDVTFSSGIATITASGGSLQSRTVVTGVTTSIANNGIGNTNITGFKSYALMKVGLSTAGWLRLYTDSASRTADASRSQGIDPSPGSGVIAEVITTGISTTQIITPFVMGGNLNSPADTTIYAAITNLSGSTQAITTNLTILQLEA